MYQNMVSEVCTMKEVYITIEMELTAFGSRKASHV